MTVPFKHWILKPKGNNEVIKTLSEKLEIHPVLANLLAQRGIDTVEKAKSFFIPDLNELHDPFLMKDMDKAVDRLIKAFSNNENVLILKEIQYF